jgi:hypothetical protein
MNMHCSETSTLLYTTAWKNDETYSLRPNGERIDEELVLLCLDSTLVTTNGRPKSRSKRQSYKPELRRVKTTMRDCRLPLLVRVPMTALLE